MGQTQSKRPSSTTTTSSTRNLINSRAASSTDFSAPIVDITPPRPPHHIHRISELIDPLTLILPDASTPPHRSRSNTLESSPGTVGTDEARHSTGRLVQSPSGNLLGAEEFLNHPNRPLAMRERRERVLSATREGFERFEMESQMETRAEERRCGKRNRRCCCWMG